MIKNYNKLLDDIRVVSSDAEITNWLSCVKHVL